MMAQGPEPPDEKNDDRSPEAKGYDIASRIFSAGAAVGLLALGGHWLDQYFGWKGPLLITGVLLGSTVFLLQMLSLVRTVSPTRSKRSKPRE